MLRLLGRRAAKPLAWRNRPQNPLLLCRGLHLSPRERDHLELHQAGRCAQYRLARGVKLNYTEAVALISMQMMERIRDGTKSVAELMTLGQSVLGRSQVMDGIPELLSSVQIEATFPDGTKLLTVHSPISSKHGDLSVALDGSFLPVPDVGIFESASDVDTIPTGIPGQVTVDPSDDGIELNAGKELVEITVTNTGDRPIQVGSHYAFVETNRALAFDRKVAFGKRLNVPAGASVRFEPGESKQITLVEIGGTATVLSGNGLSVVGSEGIVAKCEERGFQHVPAPAEVPAGRPYVIPRSSYADMYGPTTGDLIRLGDTGLEIRVEKDYSVPGDECKFGGGKTIREGMGQATGVSSDVALDTVITNALIVDAVTGIVKADVGLKDGRIVGIGKAGNPDMMDGVHPNMIVGNSESLDGAV